MRKLNFFIFLSVFFITPIFSQVTETSLYNEVMSAYNSGFLPGCVDKATNLEKSYPESPFLPAALLRKGECYARMGQATNAIETLERVQKQLYVGSEGYAESFYWKGRAKFLNKEYDDAENCFKTCCSSIRLQNAQDQSFYFNSLFYIGKVDYEKEEFEKAIRYFEYVVNNGKKYNISEYYESLQKLAMCYNNTQNYQKTVDLYDKITKICETDERKLFDKKVYQSLGDRAADAKTATGSLEEALKLYHDNTEMLSDFYVRLGVKEFENKNFLKAEEYFSEAENNQADKNADLIKLYRARMLLDAGMKISDDEQNGIKSQLIKNDVSKSDEEIVKNISDAHKMLLEIDIENLDGDYKNFDKVYYSSLVKANFFLAKYSDIQNCYKKISESENLTDGIIYITALSYYCEQKYNEAANLLESIYAKSDFNLYPSQTEIYAASKMNAEDYKSALAAYELLERDNKLTEKTKIDYAILLQKIARNESNTKRRNEQYEKSYNLTKDFTSARGAAIAGTSAFCLFRNKDAIQKYNQALSAKDLTPEIEEDVLFYKGFAEHRLWYNDKNYRAEKTFNEYQKKYPEAGNISYTYNVCAMEAYAARDKQKSIFYNEMYVKTATNEKARQSAVQTLASVYLDYQMYDKAISVYEPYLSKSDEFAMECMYKTAEIYAKAENPQKSAEMYYKLHEKYTGSKYAEDALFRSGEVLYLVSDYKKASEYFEIYTVEYPNGKYADTALYYIFDSFVQTGDKTKAILNGKMFIQKYPDSTFVSAVKRTMQQFEKKEEPKVVELTEAEKIFEKATSFYNSDKKSEAAENYLLAAEYFRRENNDGKAALCLYTATECFVHLNKKGDADATAKLLKQLYPETRYAKAVNNLLR